jgi:hypothetical protein
MTEPETEEVNDELTPDAAFELAYESMMKTFDVIKRLLSTQGDHPTPEYLGIHAQLLFALAQTLYIRELRDINVGLTE